VAVDLNQHLSGFLGLGFEKLSVHTAPIRRAG
jgi:hypothetical protein